MLQPLSSREAEVVALVAEGKTNIQIGATLELSPATVKHYLASAMRKVGVDNRTSVAKWWWERMRSAG